MMDKGWCPKECWAEEKQTGGADGMDESEDESLWSSDQKPEELQDGVSELHSTLDLLLELSYLKQQNLKLLRFLDLADEENSDLKSENMVLKLQLECLRETMQESENLGEDPVDVHAASAVTIRNQQKRIRKMEVENRALKAQCEGISSEMSSILSESKKKTVKISKLMNRQQALEQQLEEYRISIDQNSQDLQEVECPDVEKEKEREQEQSLDGIQEESPVSRRAQVQTKSWWRRQAKGLRKVIRRMGTSCSCMRSNQVHAVCNGMLPV